VLQKHYILECVTQNIHYRLFANYTIRSAVHKLFSEQKQLTNNYLQKADADMYNECLVFVVKYRI